jgi:putative ABC transport system permease protein
MTQIHGVIARMKSLWTGVRRGDALDAEMDEEFRAHIEMRAADLAQSGLPRDESMRRARAEFGGTYNYRQRARESRGLRWFDSLRFSWLDFRLGLRMLRKYPGLTVMSSLAMGVAIAIGAGGSTAISLVTSPTLPLHEGDRVVGIRLWDVETWRSERRILHDAADWRALRTIVDVGTSRGVTRNVVDDRGRAEPVRTSEMSASGFRVARVQPMLGRYLVEEDERPGGPKVIVIGNDLWRRMFGRDSSVIGRTIRFANAPHSIVGVMPPGFRFPVSYDAWVAPTTHVTDYKRREGPPLYAFGRLAPGVTLDDARAELAALHASVVKTMPDSLKRVEPRILPFAQSYAELDTPMALVAVAAVRVVTVFLLVVICVNVAVLVFARTATRQGEVAVRSALGASRGRIVAQLFGEALVLSVLGAAIGLGILWIVASRFTAMLAQLGDTSLPFWMRFEVSGRSLVWVVLLAALSAVLIGVIPALRVTGRRVQLSLQRLSSGNATVRMGRMWTALIIAEVALTVAILPAAVRFTTAWAQVTLAGPGFAADRYLSASFSLEQPQGMASLQRLGDDGTMPDDLRAFLSRFSAARAQLADRLAKEPEVLEWTFTSEIPGAEGPRRIEVESLTVIDTARLRRDGRLPERLRHPLARQAVVEVGFFDMFDVPLVAGRTFALADTTANVVMVNRSFVDSLLHGRSAVGRRIRDVWPGRAEFSYGPWKEIIGVVEDFPSRPVFDRTRVATYEPGTAETLHTAMAIVHTRGDPAAYGPRLRALALEVEPTFLVRGVGPLEAQVQASNIPLQWLTIGLGTVTLAVLVLSAAGIYALVSVIVTQRRREIGIRIALGAARHRVLSTIFGRVAAQLGIGVATGIVLASVANTLLDGDLLGARSLAILAFVAVFMGLVGVLSALAPARRGLRIQPTEALKAE